MTEFLVDLHIHSNQSPCSILELEDIIQYAQCYNIKGIAVTDHNTIGDFSKIRKIAEKYDMRTYIGYELKVLGGELLIYGVRKILPINMPAEFIIRKVHSIGGAAIAAHPYREFPISLKDNIYNLDLDGVEVSDRATHSLDNRSVSAAKKMDIAMIAGSDAHTISDIGWCATKFTKIIETTEELVNEIKSKKCIPVLIS
ncbi:MAG: PHP-associated domain-containing protein [Candidatus Odinarchaeia archaeon]